MKRYGSDVVPAQVDTDLSHQDWWHVHEACSAHMQQLMADLVYSGRGSVEAVEAMLILAEWVPRRPHSTPAVGRGEEDQAAWM